MGVRSYPFEYAARSEMSNLWQRLVGIFKRNPVDGDGDATGDVYASGQDADLAQRKLIEERQEALKRKRRNAIRLTSKDDPLSRDDGTAGNEPDAP